MTATDSLSAAETRRIALAAQGFTDPPPRGPSPGTTCGGCSGGSGTAEALAGELWRLAGWLGLERVAAPERGDLARPLAAVLAAGEERVR